MMWTEVLNNVKKALFYFFESIYIVDQTVSR